MFQSRPLRLYYSVCEGPEVPVPDDDFIPTVSRSRDPTWPTDHQSPISRLGQLPVSPPDVKPTVGVDVKPPPPLDEPTTNYFRSTNQTGSSRKRRRRGTGSEGEMTTEKRIKQEVTTDPGAGAPGHVTVTSPPVAPPTRQTAGSSALSLPVTISKDFIKELVVSRALEKTGRDCRRSGDFDSTSAAPAQPSRSVPTSQT